MSRAEHWCVGEAVQVRIGNRWRNGTISLVRQRRLHVELTVKIKEGERMVRHLLDADSKDVRKWGERAAG